MNKLDLIEIVVSKTGLSKREADEALNVAFDEICERLINGEVVKLTDFGTFTVRVRQARNGTNPKTGVAISIPETKVIGFKPSKRLKENIN